MACPRCPPAGSPARRRVSGSVGATTPRHGAPRPRSPRADHLEFPIQRSAPSRAIASASATEDLAHRKADTSETSLRTINGVHDVGTTIDDLECVPESCSILRGQGDEIGASDDRGEVSQIDQVAIPPGVDGNGECSGLPDKSAKQVGAPDRSSTSPVDYGDGFRAVESLRCSRRLKGRPTADTGCSGCRPADAVRKQYVQLRGSTYPTMLMPLRADSIGNETDGNERRRHIPKDCLPSSNVNDGITVVRWSGWRGAALQAVEQDHLSANQAPVLWHALREVEKGMPRLRRSLGQGREGDFNHSPPSISSARDTSRGPPWSSRSATT